MLKPVTGEMLHLIVLEVHKVDPDEVASWEYMEQRLKDEFEEIARLVNERTGLASIEGSVSNG